MSHNDTLFIMTFSRSLIHIYVNRIALANEGVIFFIYSVNKFFTVIFDLSLYTS